MKVPLGVQISFKGLTSHFRRCGHYIVCQINCSCKMGTAQLNQMLDSPHLLPCICPELIMQRSEKPLYALPELNCPLESSVLCTSLQ